MPSNNRDFLVDDSVMVLSKTERLAKPSQFFVVAPTNRLSGFGHLFQIESRTIPYLEKGLSKTICLISKSNLEVLQTEDIHWLYQCFVFQKPILIPAGQH